MGKFKISDIATELGYKNKKEVKEVIEKAKEMGLSRIKTASNVEKQKVQIAKNQLLKKQKQ